MSKITKIGIICLGVALLGFGCGNKPVVTTPSTPASNEAPVNVEVTVPAQTPDSGISVSASAPVIVSQITGVNISNFAFAPAEVKIKKGDTVKWTNDDSAPHVIEVDSGSSLTDLKSTMLYTGDNYSYTFYDAGTYKYHCQVHPSMQGAVIVE